MAKSQNATISTSTQGYPNVTKKLIEVATSVLSVEGITNPEDYVDADYCQIIEFDQGEFYIDFPVIFRCNVIIRGKGINKTKLIFKRFPIDYSVAQDQNHQYPVIESDDSYISVKGQKNNEVFVDISNLSMELENDVNNTQEYNHYNSRSPINLVKIYNANKVVFRNVNSSYENYTAINLDMRACSNITVENCNFVAYNNVREGGIMAIRGNTENVSIINNSFHKHGNDEIITFMHLSDDPKTTKIPECNFKRNILIKGNEFCYDYVENVNPTDDYNNDPNNPPNNFVDKLDVLMTFYDLEFPGAEFTRHEKSLHVDVLNTVRCEISNIVVCNNSFFANYSPVGCWIGFTFSKLTTHKGIEVRDNLFYQGPTSDINSVVEYRQNFSIRDYSCNSEPIVFRGNELVNNDVSYVNYGGNNYETRYSAFMVYGGMLEIIDNKISDIAPHGDIYKGLTLLIMEQTNYDNEVVLDNYEESYDGFGASVVLRGNVVSGLYRLGLLVNLNHPLARIEAFDNVFSGGTCLQCNKVDCIDLWFENNVFYSSSQIMLLNCFAKSGQVVFNNNEIHNEYLVGGNLGDQHLFYNYYYASQSNQPLPMHYLSVRGNKFHGLSSATVTYDINNRVSSDCCILEADNEYD